MRSGLKPTMPTRHSPAKLPPVRSHSLPGSAKSREPEWASDMIRGIQLKTASKTPLVATNSPRKTPGLDEVKATPSLKQQEERTFSSPQQNTRENTKDKEIEVKSALLPILNPRALPDFF